MLQHTYNTDTLEIITIFWQRCRKMGRIIKKILFNISVKNWLIRALKSGAEKSFQSFGNKLVVIPRRIILLKYMTVQLISQKWNIMASSCCNCSGWAILQCKNMHGYHSFAQQSSEWVKRPPTYRLKKNPYCTHKVEGISEVQRGAASS